MNERMPLPLPDATKPKILSATPIIDREGKIIGWAVRGDGSLDYMDQRKEDVWLEIKPKTIHRPKP